MTKEEIKNRTEVFMSKNRKICWEAEYENGQYCIGEKSVQKFISEIVSDLQSENERMKAEREWISVETELPNDNQYVIVYDGDELEFAFYQNKKFKKRDWLGTWKGVKLWMPLPQPPKQ